MQNDVRGTIGEAEVLTKLLQFGFEVSLPFSDSCQYDLILDTQDDLHRVQVKTAHYKSDRDNTITFKCKSSSREEYSNIDCFIVYHPETEQFFYVKQNEAPDTRMDIFLGESKDSRKNIASEYRLTERLK